MKIGYACINMTLPSKFRTCRLATFEKEGIQKIKEITLHNLQTVIHVLHWNIEHDILFYRLSSELVPLASHPTMDWKWWEDEDIVTLTDKINRLREQYDMRLSMHPGQYTVLSTNREQVLENSLKDLEYHDQLLELVGGRDMIIHGGGAYGDIESAKQSFVKNYGGLSQSVKDKLRLENDDKTYSLKDVLDIYDACQVPICFDIHHHTCHSNDEPLEPMLIKVFLSWEGYGTPKVHISTGRNGETDRSHHDYISQKDYDQLIGTLGGREADIMFEAKQKELSVLKIRENG
jgi:UV DNA damage endonuclease